MPKYVGRELLRLALNELQDAGGNQPRFAKGLLKVLLLKQAGATPTESKTLSTRDFEIACDRLVRIEPSDHPLLKKYRYYNPFGPEPLRADSWPRGTLYTRRDEAQWRDVLIAKELQGVATWTLVQGYADAIVEKLKNERLRGAALAVFLLRRPSALEPIPQFEDLNGIIAKFKESFRLDQEDAKYIDFSIPPTYGALVEEELSANEVRDCVSGTEKGRQLQLLLAARAQGSLRSLDDQIVGCARQMGQVLLYGPPGTGKTYWAERAALKLTGHDDLNTAVRSGQVRVMVWHPSTSYEDFVRGQTVRSGNLLPRPGTFEIFCDIARANPADPFVLIVDEINRGNTVAILGELLFGLEQDKRGKMFQLSDHSSFSIPENVYLIGTANTADRSIAALDVALGRRFARVEIPPQPNILGDVTVLECSLQSLLALLNRKIGRLIDRDHRLGHAYFLDESGNPIDTYEELVFVLRYRVIPLLQDYALDDFGILEELLGRGFVEVDERTIREEAFSTEEALRVALDQLMGK